MAKKVEILGAPSKKVEIIGASAGVPKIVGVQATGNNVLIERLTKQELASTRIFVGEGTDTSGPPQAYVLQIGPLVSKECGFKVGDRVLVTGTFTPVPAYDESPRERGVLLPDMIKAVLVEA